MLSDAELSALMRGLTPREMRFVDLGHQVAGYVSVALLAVVLVALITGEL